MRLLLRLMIYLPVILFTVSFTCHSSQAKTGNKINSMELTNNTSIREEKVTYSVHGTNLVGYLTYDDQVKGKRPVVLVVPEWWGLNDYPRMRAKMLAQLGYLAMAVDMYGNGNVATNPQEAMNYAKPFYTNPALGKERLDAALSYIKNNPMADASRTAAIGYCFGGSVVLNSAKMGSDLDAVVSFHGGLQGPPPPKGMKTKFLICHGASDASVTMDQLEAFKKSMDSVGANYTVKVYPNATHAFSNPESDKTGQKYNMPIRYNPEADHASWNEMKEFLEKVFR
jgi:dienelactone hydrolase